MKIKGRSQSKKRVEKKKMKRLTFILSANILNYYNPTKQGGKVLSEKEVTLELKRDFMLQYEPFKC